MSTASAMSRPVPIRPLLVLALVAGASLCGAGCRDAQDGDPLAVVLDERTRGALSLERAIPSLPEVVETASASFESARDSAASHWVGRWEASWLLEPPRGRTVRGAVYDEAVEPLAHALGPEGVERVLRSTGEAAAEAATTDRIELPPPYRIRVEEAEDLVARGREALDAGASAHALRAALEAADRMRAVSPESVAHLLLARARRAAAEAGRPPETEDEGERIDRLIRGAETAMEEGDFRRAVHRAYYACRLLDVKLP